MNLKQLQYFVTVADEGSISAGAKKLFLSQPPLSTQLRDLEEEFGCLLFQRGSRNITLTEPGKTLYQYAKTILDLSRVAKEEVATAADPGKGTVRIGMVSSLVCEKALRWLADFSEVNPRIDFEITEGNTYQLLEQLQAGTIHLALIRTPYTKGALESFRLATERMVAIGQKNLFDDGDSVTLAQLSQQPIIVYRRWEATIKNAFTQQNLKPHIRILADDSRTAVKAAELGLGIGLVPASAAEILHEKNTVIRGIAHEELQSSIEIVHTKDGYLPGCSDRFLRFLKGQAEIDPA